MYNDLLIYNDFTRNTGYICLQAKEAIIVPISPKIAPESWAYCKHYDVTKGQVFEDEKNPYYMELRRIYFGQ